MFTLNGILTPRSYLEKHQRSHAHGFTMPAVYRYESHSALVPLAFDDRIDGFGRYQLESDSMHMEELIDADGATHFTLGQPAIYAFVCRYRNSIKVFRSIRQFMIPQLENWLRQGQFGDTDDNALIQAKVFCDGNIPPELNEQYAQVERDIHLSQRQSRR